MDTPTPTIQHSLDWLQYSVNWPDVLERWPIDDTAAIAVARTAIPHLHVQAIDMTQQDSNRVFGMQGYLLTYNFQYATVHIHPEIRNQKMGVRMTGDNLRLWRELGGTNEKLAGAYRGLKANASRVDIAFDLFDWNIDINRIFLDWKAGKVTTRARKVSPYTEARKDDNGVISEGTTLYFGSRTSQIMLRLYDKGKQMKVGKDWKRLEIEVKGERAHTTMQDIYAHGLQSVGVEILRDYADMPYKFWRKLMECKSVELQQIGRKETDTLLWLENVVIPLLEREMTEQWDTASGMHLQAAIEAIVSKNWRTRAAYIRDKYYPTQSAK